ncbi:MAG: hypothetical protein K9N51_12270 [Candidatus Pacebacteria bacterium]|nr:hypothetical protein [Candidatus Paceibacterota bacterium]
MHTTITLTVAESKRLIARGLANTNHVKRALTEGIVAVAPGSTDGYVVEELTHESIDKTQFVTGRTLPSGYNGRAPGKKLADLVLKNGERLDMAATDAVAEMGAGDVFIKGANAINLTLDQVGVLIGHPTGGTLGATLGTITARRILLIHPVGIEKSVPADLNEAALLQKEKDGQGPTLWVSPGRIFTEIDAFAVVCDVQAIPIAAGGIGGAEGACWFMLLGDRKALERAEALVAGIQGEPPFLG